MSKPLSGRTIAVPETRLRDALEALLTARGAAVRACPLVSILDPEDFSAVDHWLGGACEDGLDDLVLLTGEGLRRLMARATQIRLGQSFRELLAGCRTVCRGPKPAAALRELGLKAGLSAAEPTTPGVIRTLQGLDLADRRVGVQCYGQQEQPALMAALTDACATPLPVYPYRYADEALDRQVIELIRELAAGDIDAITFTSSPQVRRLFAVAEAAGLIDELRTGLDSACVVAVGPVVAEALDRRGLRVDVVPESSYFIKPMVSALVAHWDGQQA